MLNRRTTTLLVVLALSCAAPPPPQLKPPAVGVVTGEVFVENPARVSVDGAFVELAGTSTRVLTQAGRQFVLTAVPVGENLITITHPPSGRVRRLTVKVEQANQTIALPAEQTTLQAAARLAGSVSVSSGTVAGAIAYLVGGSGRQAAIVGDDGSFVLEGLPPGVAKIGVQLIGFTSVVKSLTLAEGDNDGGTFALTPPATTAGTLTLSSAVKLADRTDHSGIAVLLNGGEKVATTDAEGAYAFTGLSPGLVTLRAVLSGYRSVDLPPVSLNADGSAEGLVTALLTPGSDSENTGTDPNRTFTVHITSPASGTAVELGSEVTFHAETAIDGEVIPPARVKWTAEGVEPVTASRNLGTGTIVSVSTLPLGLHLVRATATAADGESKYSEILLEVRPIALSVEITSHRDNAQVVAGVPGVFAATVGVRPGIVVGDTSVTWSVRPFGTAETPTVLGQGLRLAAALPAVTERTLLEIRCEVVLPGGLANASAAVAVFAVPFRPTSSVLPVFQGFGLAVPQPVNVLDNAGKLVQIDYAISERQPVLLRASVDDGSGGDFAGTVRWQSDTGILFTGLDADLSLLPVGTHDFTLSVESDDGASASTVVRVVVSAFVFTATVTKPVLGPTTPYFVDFGLPLEGAATHPYQSAFPPTSVRWRAPDGRVVSSGFRSTVRNLPAGPGSLTLEVTDVLGQVATADASYVLQAITFQASMLAPSEGTDVLEGTPVSFRATATHSLVPSVIPASQLKIRFLSNIQGLLVSASGVSEVGLDTVFTPASLVAGTHVVTARVTDGTLTTETTRSLRIRSPGVSAALQSPVGDLTVFPGTNVRFATVVSSDASVTPRVSWLLDGTEFDSTWGAYGSDPTATARRTLDFGAYSATSAPFTSPRWSPGNHRVQLFVRAPDVDASVGCVTIPNRATCLSTNVVISPANPDIAANTVITAGQTVVWEGLRRMRGHVTVNGGTLIVNPGARIVVDAGSYSDRYLRVYGGTLRIGSINAVEPVVFEASAPGVNQWGGIRLEPSLLTTDATVSIENTTIRNTETGVYAPSTNWNGDNHRAELRQLTIESSSYGLYSFCPQVADRVTFRNVTLAAITESNRYNCGAVRTYRRLRFENCSLAFNPYYFGSSDIVIEQSVFVGTPTFNQSIQAGSLTLRDNVFDSASRSGLSAFSYTPGSNGGARLRFERNVFSNNATTSAVFLDGYNDDDVFDEPQRELYGNLFLNNTAALRDRTFDRRRVLLHGNTFTGNVLDLDADRSVNSSSYPNGPDVEAQGNFLGGAGDVGTAGGALMALQPGATANLPKVLDVFDATVRERVLRVDNPLQQPATAPQLEAILAGSAWPTPPLVVNTPLAIIRRPVQTQLYRSDRCLPLEALAPLSEVNVATDCRWLAAPNDVPNAPFQVVTRTPAGCLDATQFSLREGEFRIRLECTAPESGRVDAHETRVKLTNAMRSGEQSEPVEEWSGEVLLDGDFVVPAGHTLRLLPGTRIRFAANDRLRMGRAPAMLTNTANYAYGSRALVDLWIDGTLDVQGTAQNPVVLESVTGAALAGQWGGIRVDRGATAKLSNVRITGATVGVHGLVTWNEPGEMPTIEVRNSVFSAVSAALKGACPSVFDQVTVDRAEYVLQQGRCHQAVSFTNGTFTRLTLGNDNEAVLHVTPTLIIGPPALAFAASNLTFSREAGNRVATAIRIEKRTGSSFGFSQLTGVTFEHFRAMLDWDVSAERPESIELSRVRATNFEVLFDSMQFNEEDELVIRDSAFENATHAIRFPVSRLIVTGSTFRDVRTPFGYFSGSTYYPLDIGSGRLTTLDVRGNRFERAGRVLGLRHIGGTSVTLAATLSGNEFIGTLDKVVVVDSANLTGGNTISVDARNSWWGVATEPGVQALITDPQAAPGAGYKGRTRYEGFAAGALNLPTP